MLGEYKLIHIGGVTRNNEKLFRKIEKELTLMGHICFAPVIYDYNEWLPNQEMLDKMCHEKLLICDAFLIATPWHVGKSTSLRVKEAINLQKEVLVYNHENHWLELYKEGMNYDNREYGYTQSGS